MKSYLNHIAYLVESIEESLAKADYPQDLIGPIEEFPSEGTREVYVGKPDQLGKVLFMQAIGEGPYQAALEKRGPGLHHVAIDVENIDAYIEQLSGSGWYIHPKSLGYYRDHQQVFLCRPGTVLMIEVQQRTKIVEQGYFVEFFQFPFENEKMREALLCDALKMGPLKLSFERQASEA